MTSDAALPETPHAPDLTTRQLSRLRISDEGTVAFPQSTWTSFDRYDRYADIARIVRSALGPGRHVVLDVGDTAGYLELFEPGLWVVGVDVQLEAKRLDGSRPVLGDGARLPFRDDTFDAVVSSDVLEHIPPARRHEFLAELRRVSRDLVVVAAPFDTVGVAGVEELVRRYAMLALGAPQPQLEEHHDNGLPDVDDTLRSLLATGGEGALIGNGNLWDWLVSMLLRFQLESRPALGPLSEGFDVFHNTALLGSRQAPPFYRHLVVAWLDHAPDLVPSDAVGAPVDLLPLAAALVAADSTEVVRQDLNGMLVHQVLPPIAVVDAGILALHERLGGLTEYLLTMPDLLAEKLEGMSADVAQLREAQVDTRARVEELFQAQMPITSPLLRVIGMARRVRDKVRRLRGR